MDKFLALFVALMIVVASMSVALAEDGHTISVQSTDTHTYKVFQVLTGTLSGEGSTALGDPKWGADAIADPGDVNAFITSITAEGISDQDIAQLVAAKVNTSGAGRGTVDKDNPINNLATGYYVLVDTTALTGDHAKDTKALNVVKVVNDIDGIQIKWSTTSDEKEIVSDTLGKDSGVNTINDDDSTETKYKKNVSKTVDSNVTDHKASMEVNANSLARFDGLGEGTYTINETVTPAGYNTVSDLTVTVTFNEDGTTKWSFSGGNGGYDGSEGIYKITIKNNKGTELPSTGGMGTTILYVVGSILVLAAVVLLVTKRRMSNED